MIFPLPPHFEQVAGVAVDFVVKTPEGKVLGGQERFGNFVKFQPGHRALFRAVEELEQLIDGVSARNADRRQIGKQGLRLIDDGGPGLQGLLNEGYLADRAEPGA